jgi:hypothetical protein
MLIGILTIPRLKSSKRNGIITTSINIKKIKIKIKRIIIKTIIPLILGNLNNTKIVETKKIIKVKIKTDMSKFPIVNCMSRIESMEKNPHIIEIA